MRTVFLDRDGVINDCPAAGQYVTSWREFEFLPGAVQAIRILNNAGFLVIVVTNQRGIALERMTEDALHEIHGRMTEEMSRSGARLDAIYHCPHEENSCGCRKPKIGLFLRAQSEFPDIVFAESFVIGDSDRDIEAGRRLGARLIRIGQPAAPDELCASSLVEAVSRHVLACDGKR